MQNYITFLCKNTKTAKHSKKGLYYIYILEKVKKIFYTEK